MSNILATVQGIADGTIPTTPLPHGATHENAGADSVNVEGLGGVLTEPQSPIIGATGITAVAGDDPRLDQTSASSSEPSDTFSFEALANPPINLNADLRFLLASSL